MSNDAQQPDRPWASRERSYDDYTFTERRDGWIIVRGSSGEPCSIPPEARYTLARVVLADQPFGVTPEDAERLRSLDLPDYDTVRW